MAYSLTDAKRQLSLIEPRLTYHLLCLYGLVADEPVREGWIDELDALMVQIHSIRIGDDFRLPSRKLLAHQLFYKRFRPGPAAKLNGLMRELAKQHPHNDLDVIELYLLLEGFHLGFAGYVSAGIDTIDMLDGFPGR